LSADRTQPAPEHEHLICQQSDGGDRTCFYNKLPEPNLNFQWDTTRGTFHGVDVTATWVCPESFGVAVCESVTSVVEGVFVFERQFNIRQDLVVTNEGSTETLYAYWVDFGFACPWFRTFAQAFSANPFPLPFDGVNWPAPAAGCLFTP
jgi:hypothetical protein